VRSWAFLGLVTIGVIALLVWAFRSLGPASVGFAALVVWLPMTWLGTASRIRAPRLPEAYHRLRPFEREGRIYGWLGVRLFKRLLRRGPASWWNPELRLPAEPTAERLAHLDQRMRDAEASHALLFVLTLAVAAHAAVRGWWPAAGWTLVFDVLVNGYPVMLQRYNRALLEARIAREASAPADPRTPPAVTPSRRRHRS
jgi:hypothetical protein